MTKLINLLTAAAIFALAAAPLSAIPALAHAEQVYIPVNDLDLARPADKAIFKRRVDDAANKICSTLNRGARDLITRTACQDAVYEEAVAKLGDAQRESLRSASRVASAPPAWSLAAR